MLIRRSVSIRPARTAPQSLCHRRRQHTSVRFNTRRPKFSLVNRTTQRHRSTPRPAFLPATRFPQASFSIAEMSSQATSDAAASDPASLVGSYRTESLKLLYNELKASDKKDQEVAETVLRHCRAGALLDAAAVNTATVTQDQFVSTLYGLLSEVDVFKFDALVRALSTQPQLHRLRFQLPPPAIAGLAQEIMEVVRKAGDAVASVPEGKHTFENTVGVLAALEEVVEPLVTSVNFMSQVSPDKPIRDVSTAADKQLDEFFVEQGMRLDVYHALDAYNKTNPTLEGEQQRLLERVLRDFRRRGMHLEEKQRAEMQELQTQMGKKCIEFSQNLAEENTTLLFTEQELEGLPADKLKSLERKGDKCVMTLKYPDYYPCMRYCKVAETRRQMEAAYLSRCMVENTKLLEDLVELRARQAKLLGYRTHSHYVLETRMADGPETVVSFLEDLSTKLQPLADADRAALMILKEAELKERGEEYDGKLYMYDVAYYQRMRTEKEYQVDYQAVRQYFPLETVTTGLLDIYQELLGLRFAERVGVPVWHDEVRCFEVFDSASGAFVGHFYLDLHPRDGKYGHAACFGLQPGCKIFSELKDFMPSPCDDVKATSGSEVRQYPVAAMVANFSAPTATKPSLLTHQEVVTYFHEFGHVMHQLCSLTDYVRFSGTRVERDFVEAPSQMLENWCYEAEALRRMSGHWERPDEKLPDALITKLAAAKNANAGLLNKRQLVFGLFDQSIHSKDRADTAQDFAKTLREVMSLEATPNTNFAAGFGHLAGGYDSTYYGYMWAETFSADMFHSRFKKEGIMSATTGQAYRREILQPGGSRDAMESLRAFLGREPIMEPFLISKGLSL